MTLSHRSLRIRHLYNNHSIIFKATIVHSFFTKHLLCWVHENAVQELYSVSIVKRRKETYNLPCWLMRHRYILSVQPMDFTKWSLPFNACLQDAGINEAPRTFSQYLLPTTGSQYSDLSLLSFPYFSLFCEMGSCLDFIPTKLSFTLMPLGFYLHPSLSLPIAMMFHSISEDFLPLLFHLFPCSHVVNLRW